MFYSQSEIDHHRAWPSKAGCLIHEPVYISIDKDVLRKQDAVTDWSNGDMSLLQLQAVLRIIYAHERVVGVNITGECSASLDYLSELKSAAVDNRANEELMRMICQHDCGWKNAAFAGLIVIPVSTPDNKHNNSFFICLFV